MVDLVPSTTVTAYNCCTQSTFYFMLLQCDSETISFESRITRARLETTFLIYLLICFRLYKLTMLFEEKETFWESKFNVLLSYALYKRTFTTQLLILFKHCIFHLLNLSLMWCPPWTKKRFTLNLSFYSEIFYFLSLTWRITFVVEN